MRFGAPKSIYVDNGREFLTADLGGNGHRTQKGSEEIPSTILKRLDVEMHNAIVCNARAKPIERLLYGKKHFPSYLTVIAEELL